MRYARTFGHSNIADEVELLVAFSVFNLGICSLANNSKARNTRAQRKKTKTSMCPRNLSTKDTSRRLP